MVFNISKCCYVDTLLVFFYAINENNLGFDCEKVIVQFWVSVALLEFLIFCSPFWRLSPVHNCYILESRFQKKLMLGNKIFHTWFKFSVLNSELFWLFFIFLQCGSSWVFVNLEIKVLFHVCQANKNVNINLIFSWCRFLFQYLIFFMS